MALHEFVVKLSDGVVFGPQIDALYEATGGDCTLRCCGKEMSVRFTREHPGTIGDAMLSARDDLRKAGFTPVSATSTVYFDD